MRRVLCTEGQRCSVHASFPWQRQLLPPHLFVLAESPAVLCAETAKRGETISPPPATWRRGQRHAGREQKPCLHQQYGVLGGARQSRKDRVPFLVGNSTSPNVQKCKLTSQSCTSQQATCALPGFTRIASFDLLGRKYREEKHTTLEMRNSRAASTQGSLCRIRWRVTERAGRPSCQGTPGPMCGQ